MEKRFFAAKTRMMLQVLILRKASRSNRLPLVSPFSFYLAFMRSSYTIAELELDEEGTRISLTVVDTPGFGDQIDNEDRHVCSLLQSLMSNAILLASPRLSNTLSVNMTTSLLKSRGSSAIQDSKTIAFTPYSTSLHQQGMGMFPICHETVLDGSNSVIACGNLISS